MFKYLVIIFIFASSLNLYLVLAENINQDETSGSVKELTDFHEVIYQIWHEAWPEKNIGLLTKLLPDIEKGAKKVEKAKLPGILREKKVKWEEGLKELKSIVKEYKSAVQKKDSAGIMNNAEKLHSQFERLVRTIRPAMKELDAYHVVLYKLYHYYMPDYNYEKIKTSIDELTLKMESLLKAEVPKRITAKSDKFNDARNELDLSLKALSTEVSKGNNKKEIEKAIGKMHSKYQSLECLFD